ncbi:helicase C-terminal domain-containing protein [Liquorilactobacillus oeni]|nr:helicase C-terminal domain-containing protein [Liquorilactobacillus oeni]
MPNIRLLDNIRKKYICDKIAFRVCEKVGGTMSPAPIYAVVDIETTGTAMDGSNRIIQFSCVLVKDNKIANIFNTMVNPLMKIPEEVQQLTGITPKDVRKAPLFDDLAGTIYELLQGTVFVAHNINFDYRFLNTELERCGYPSLEIDGIDTVQLSQILLPTLPSYRLAYLGSYLNIVHSHPHRADSDASVTAQLLLFLLKQIENLPIQLLEQAVRFRSSLLFQTGECFLNALRLKQKNANVVPDYLENVSGMLLRRIEKNIKFDQSSKFPRTDAEKKKLFLNFLNWRKAQSEMMNRVFAILSQSGSERAILEAPTGLGKTLGYMIPAAYASQAGKGTVISTATTALQTQLLEQVIPLMRQILPFEFEVAVFKGSQNYIDLGKFARTLKQVQNSQTRLLQLRLLVWLTITKTGDLTELHLTKYQNPLFDEIRHHGPASLDSSDTFYSVDFVHRQQLLEKNADLIITNHAYLVRHAAELGGLKKRDLIVDEAQHLGEIALKNNRDVIDFDELKILCDTLLVKMESKVSFSLKNLSAQHFLTIAESKEIIKKVQLIDQRIPKLRDKLYKRFVNETLFTTGFYEETLRLDKFFGFVKENLGDIKQISKAAFSLQRIFKQLTIRFSNFKAENRIDRTAEEFLYDFCSQLQGLIESLKTWERLSLDELEELSTEILVSISLPLHQPGAHLRLRFSLFRTKNFLEPNVYANFKHVLFVGASLVLPSSPYYMLDQLDLAHETQVISFKGIFDYRKQALALLVADAPDVSQNASEYTEYIGKTLENIILHNKRRMMVLFNSLTMIQKIYDHLKETGITEKRLVLAQGITGSNEKVVKSFKLAESAILLGSGAFWEGIDLPKDKLELLVITRLPFQSPDTLLNRAKYSLIEKQGLNSFTEIALPETMMRLKQGFGRLIRTPEDKGVLIVLDSRVISRTYGSRLRTAFPEELPVRIVETKELETYLHSFWQK